MKTSNPALQQFLDRTSNLRDPLGGITGVLGELPRPSGHPTLFHYATDVSGLPPLEGSLSPDFRIMKPLPAAGVSVDPVEAQVRSIGESIERYCMSVWNERQFIRATANELGAEAVDLDSVPRCSPHEPAIQQGSFAVPRKDVPMRWVKGFSLIEGKPRYVPAIMTYLFLSAENLGENIWAPISTGCASHPDLYRALVSGICESIERDSLMLTWLHQLPLPEIVLGEESELREDLRELLEIMRRSGLEHRFFDATSDLGVPTIYALQMSEHSDLLSTLVVSATRLDATDALARTLEEGCSSRIAIDARLAALKPGESYRRSMDELFSLEDCALYYAPREVRSEFDFLLRNERSKSLSEMPVHQSLGSKSDLDQLLSVLSARGMDAIAIDLTTPEVREQGLWVVRVFIPQLVPLTSIHQMRYLDTPRLYDAPERMGYGRRSISDITNKPQPFA